MLNFRFSSKKLTVFVSEEISLVFLMDVVKARSDFILRGLVLVILDLLLVQV